MRSSCDKGIPPIILVGLTCFSLARSTPQNPSCCSIKLLLLCSGHHDSCAQYPHVRDEHVSRNASQHAGLPQIGAIDNNIDNYHHTNDIENYMSTQMACEKAKISLMIEQ